MSRKSYTFAFKRQIIEEARSSSLSEVARKYHLDLRMVRRWIKIEIENPNARRISGGGRKPFISDNEDMIFDWIIDRRIQSLAVSRKDIQEFALRLVEDNNELKSKFKASTSWLRMFMNRYELSLRRSTTLFKLDDSEIVRRAVLFKAHVDSIRIGEYNPQFIIAMDETSVYFGNANQTTVEQRGATSIRVPSTGYESARVTCILGISVNGVKLPPYLIKKGTKNDFSIRNGVVVLESERAWCTQAVIRKWVERVFPLVLMGNSRGLLFWDSASTHRAKATKEFLKTRRIDQVMIPAGMTSHLQSLDIVINKPFKDAIRSEINCYIEHRMQRNTRGNLIRPSIDEVCSWVRNAWDKITGEMVNNALTAGYVGRDIDFSNTYIGKHEVFGPLIVSSRGQHETVFDSDDPEADELLVENQ